MIIHDLSTIKIDSLMMFHGPGEKKPCGWGASPCTINRVYVLPKVANLLGVDVGNIPAPWRMIWAIWVF